MERILGRLDDLDSTNLAILVQRLARERALLETVFNTIQEGILVVDETGLIEYANAAAYGLIGLKPEDEGQTTLWKLMPDLARSLDMRRKPWLSGQGLVSREFEISYPEKRFIRFYMVPFPDRSEDDATTRFAAILSDITEEKLSTEEMIENERLSSIFDLAAGVAHEIGNPLNSITIHLQLIKRQLARIAKGPPRDKIAASVDVCTHEVERLDGIINHFLQAIRPRPLDLQKIQLLDVLGEVIQFLEQELRNLRVQVEVQINEEPPPVTADRNQIKQVFFNITKNAMEAMDSGGELKVTTRVDDDSLYIYFADSGVGISREDLGNIFKPYFTTKKDGHGLGMMIVQRIMRDHGGQIGIDSRSGKGTVVYLRFPLEGHRVRMLEDSSSG